MKMWWPPMEHNLFKEREKVESKAGSHPHDHNIWIQKDLNDNMVSTRWMITLKKDNNLKKN